MQWIKKLLFAITLLFSFLAYAQDDDLINWSADRKLQWKDYLAAPDTHSGAAASTSTQMGFEYHVRDNNLTYTINCKFSKSKSWGRYKNDYILSHEQGHFDIAEISTRKMVKALREYKFNSSSFRSDLNKIYSTVVKEKEHLQQQYDNETDYSRKQPQQEEWLKKIGKMLEEYKEYADY